MTETRSGTHRARLVLAVVATAVVTALAVLAVVAVLAASGRTGGPSAEGDTAVDPECTVPDLPGAAVTVFLTDMGLEPDGQHGRMTTGTAMFLSADPTIVPEGAVSFLAINGGRLTHELLVLPLASDDRAGTRSIGDGSTVAESGLLGEASASCGEGLGDGIAPDTSGWVTLTLPPGRYELVCNLPGHYEAGMHAEFTVTDAATTD